MPNTEFKTLLKKFHEGSITDEEQLVLFEMMNSKSNDGEMKEAMMDIWVKTENTSPLGFDKEAMFENIELGFEREVIANRKHIGFTRTLVGIAAAVTVLLVSFFLVYDSVDINANSEVSIADVREFKTQRGQFRTVSLPDGTVVKLNTNSSLKIGQTYSSDQERVVYLSGEAFFDVSRNEKKPFKVITNDIEVQVLGTSFNVNANFNGKASKVAVASGKVKVESVDSSNQVFLMKDQMVTISENQFLKQTGFDPIKEFGWVERMLVFDQADFKQVVTQLENWYGVDVQVSGYPEANGEWRYTATFENHSLENVLLSMGFVKKFDYQIIDKNVEMRF